MKIILSDTYKSLQRFASDELDDLTVITGKNGSGKSQLLDLISKKAKNDTAVAAYRIEFDPTIKNIQAEGLIKDNSVKIGHDEWKAILQSRLNSFRALSETSRKLMNYVLDNDGFEAEIKGVRSNQLVSNESEYLELLAKFNVESGFGPSGLANKNIAGVHQMRALNKILSKQNVKLNFFIRELSKLTGKEETELTDSDFFTTPIREDLVDENDLFSSQVELIFYNYAKRRDINRRNYFDKLQDGDDNNSISDEDFLKNFIPPWEIINQILDHHNIDFYFKGIDKKGFTTDIPMDFQLYKKSTNDLIPFEDLSSGEKVIIGLILKLFTSKYYGESMSFPELFILDEPDAHLHPEMSKLLLDVLEETFVNKFKIKVILTTHSPSTIALCNDNCIYQLTNGAKSGLKKISKDEALQILTSFIPTLSIDYKNHKQVFVESPTDVNYYQSLHDKHQQNIKGNKLYFISNSAGKSNCSQVYSIVKAIRASGSQTSFGIVDWDLSNKPENYIFVHGENERYSVENFILDPIYVVGLLIEMNNAHNVCESIGVDKMYNQYSLGNESETRIQEVVKFYFDAFEKKFPTHKYDCDLTEIEYLNGKKIKLPDWYLKMQGHDIVTKIKIVFKSLEKYPSEGDLQNALIKIMNKSYPFVPLTTIKTIEGI